jgi:hypothetical protein
MSSVFSVSWCVLYGLKVPRGGWDGIPVLIDVCGCNLANTVVLRLSLHTHFLPASNHTAGMMPLKDRKHWQPSWSLQIWITKETMGALTFTVLGEGPKGIRRWRLWPCSIRRHLFCSAQHKANSQLLWAIRQKKILPQGEQGCSFDEVSHTSNGRSHN